MRTTIGLVAVALLIGGCGSPNTVNVALRKENQALTEQLAQLQAQEAADRESSRATQRVEYAANQTGNPAAAEGESNHVSAV